jgi:hypothetical protein
MVKGFINPVDYVSIKGSRRYALKSDPSQTISQRSYREAKTGERIEERSERRRELGIRDEKQLNKDAVKSFQQIEFKQRTDAMKAAGLSVKKEKPLTVSQVRKNQDFQAKFKDLKRVNKGKKRVKLANAKKRLRAYLELDLITEEEYMTYLGDF